MMLLFADLLGTLAVFILFMLPVNWMQRVIAPWPDWTVIPVFSVYLMWVILSAGIVGLLWGLM